MRENVKYLDTAIEACAAAFADDFLESVFFTGNGRMGARAFSPFEAVRRPVQAGLFVAGIFGEIKPGITDFVNLPTPIFEDIYLDRVKAAASSAITYRLDLSCGLFSLAYDIAAADKHAHVLHERFFPLDKPALLVQRTTITPASRTEVTLESGVYTASCNNPIPDDQVKENKEWVQLAAQKSFHELETGFSLVFDTLGTGLRITEETNFIVHAPQSAQSKLCVQKEDAVTQSFSANLATGESFVLDKATAVFTSRDVDPLIQRPAAWSFDGLLLANKAAWERALAVAAIEIGGDAKAQTALRYCVFQLIANCSARDATVSIGARGLTHTRYKGCYFWDTDFFMLPFYAFTNPSAAKNLLQYRVNALPQAKAHSAKMNTAGARYPWMASFDASEQCESWDIGASEVHITADVVFALAQYIRATGDEAFLENSAAEVYIETARFWCSRYTLSEDGSTANLLFCKGPDEYCGITSNNLFTNLLVKSNLSLAANAARLLQKKQPEHYRQLDVDEAEIEQWLRLKELIPLPKDSSTGRYRTDDTFHLLEAVDLAAIKRSDSASYHDVCFDRLQRYKVVKQADVLLLMTRMKEAFTEAERLAAWADFEPLCLHDSTLSFASHALFAAQNGLLPAAEQYFNKALYLDLKEIMGNTGKEGLHLAGLGETWQAVMFGFCGLSFDANGPTLAPQLPENWNSLRAHFYYQGDLYALNLTKTTQEIKKVAHTADSEAST